LVKRLLALPRKLRMAAGAFMVDNAFQTLARLGKLHPKARQFRQGVEVLRDIRYKDGAGADHLLDVYRPSGHADKPRPVVLYVHGGGFRFLSKETHWIMGLAFARRGFVTFVVNYRLAPKHPFPAAIHDACDALRWVRQHAARYGGDPDRILLAGESAGANLVTSLALATATRRPEPWARAVFDDGIRPLAVLPACGIFQVSDTQRFARRRKMNMFIMDRLREVEGAYLHKVKGDTDLADPLVVFERAATGKPLERPLPPFFTFVGTKDPLLDDTRRLHAALTALGTKCEVRYYPGEIHAFHALVWRENAIACWREMYSFVDACLGPEELVETAEEVAGV
jgi:acetyl esterase